MARPILRRRPRPTQPRPPPGRPRRQWAVAGQVRAGEDRRRQVEDDDVGQRARVDQGKPGQAIRGALDDEAVAPPRVVSGHCSANVGGPNRFPNELAADRHRPQGIAEGVREAGLPGADVRGPARAPG